MQIYPDTAVISLFAECTEINHLVTRKRDVATGASSPRHRAIRTMEYLPFIEGRKRGGIRKVRPYTRKWVNENIARARPNKRNVTMRFGETDVSDGVSLEDP